MSAEPPTIARTDQAKQTPDPLIPDPRDPAASPAPSPAPAPGPSRLRPLDELELPAVHASVPRARAFMRALVTARAVQHVREDAEVLVSELVTNAVRHAATPRSTLRLTVLRAGPRLRIEVHDPSPFPPRVRRVDLMDETGRGWFLVAAIADRHGTDQTVSGKCVWCELTAWPAPGPPVP
ncbi:ATP-binding protein [Actinomadura rugatobispora]|uniref:ATP-binding protein n=1 Tax=Actinomadura rugatobispora TaxID=1994 RepID=A0ABW1A533_9ACTN|nr:hypothetical protein GCM10010200_025990 [Actinomadura rugatobispora]